MSKLKLFLIYIALMTAILANMDWKPIHYAWWHNGEWPAYAQNFERWSQVRYWTAMILCPPCAPLAENYYYVLMEIEAGEEEQAGVLPVGWNHNPINPHGDWTFRWGQGEDREWRKVSMLSLYLYWLTYTILWWYGWKLVFWAGRIISWTKSHRMMLASTLKSRMLDSISSSSEAEQSLEPPASYSGVYLSLDKPGYLVSRLLRLKTSK